MGWRQTDGNRKGGGCFWREMARTAKTVRLPVLLLWSLAVLVCAAYFLSPSVRSALAVFGGWQQKYGKTASFVNRVVTGGLIPGFFLVVLPSVRPPHVLRLVALQTLWAGWMGLPQDVWFCFQDWLFGPRLTCSAVVWKTVMDQFVWAVFIVTPLNALFYTWSGNQFSCDFGGRRKWWRALVDFYGPNIVMNWLVWIPVVAVIYMFPLALQMTVSGLIGAIWSLLCLTMGGAVGRKENT